MKKSEYGVLLPTLTGQALYKCFRQFNKTPIHSLASSRSSMTAAIAAHYFAADTLQDRLVRELGHQKVLPIKPSRDHSDNAKNGNEGGESTCPAQTGN